MSLGEWNDLKLEETFKQNREKFFKRESIDGTICIPHLTHSSKVAILSEENCGERVKADGFVTAFPQLFPVITVADCFPLYFYDPVKNVIGLAHAGWKGIVENIIRNIITIFARSFHSDPKNILLAIGPGIQKCHFVVKKDIINQFHPYQRFIEEHKNNEYAVDLASIIVAQAKQQGIINIETSNLCTFCLSDKYFSYRRDKPKIIEVMIAYIGIRR